MNLVLSSTQFNYPGHIYTAIGKDNLIDLSLSQVKDGEIDSLIIHRCLHLLEKQAVQPLLESLIKKLKDGGKLTIYCIDVYLLAQKIHRRELGEMDFDAIFYENSQKNCMSTLSMLNICRAIGLKKSAVSLTDVYAVLEFTK